MKMQKKREKTELLESSEKTTEIVNHRITTQKFNENANEKIGLCGVARALNQISENGPWSKKLGHPWSR